jgi:hypothetical protein
LLGAWVGGFVGEAVGALDATDGGGLGDPVGLEVRARVGAPVGDFEGSCVGGVDGVPVATAVGFGVGSAVVGEYVGVPVGAIVGGLDGVPVGGFDCNAV